MTYIKPCTPNEDTVADLINADVIQRLSIKQNNTHTQHTRYSLIALLEEGDSGYLLYAEYGTKNSIIDKVQHRLVELIAAQVPLIDLSAVVMQIKEETNPTS